MKRRLMTAFLLLCAAFLLSACTSERTEANQEEALLLCNPFSECAVFLTNDGQMTSVSFPDRGGDFFRTFVCGTQGIVFYAEGQETAEENEIRNRVYAVDAKSGEETVIAATTRNIVMLEVYQGKVYVLEYDWRETSGSGYTERVFIPDGNGGYIETQENQYLYDILWEQGFTMLRGRRRDGVDGFYTISYCKNVLGEILLRSESTKIDVVAVFDTEGVFSKEISLEEKYGFLAADRQYILSRLGDGGTVLYCRGTGERERMPEEKIDTILTISEGTVFYANKQEEKYGIEKISVYRYNIEEKERKLLYKTENKPGYGWSLKPGITGFFSNGDFCYFIDTEDGEAAWYKQNLKEAGTEVLKTGAVAKRYGFMDYGTAVSISEKRNCPVCGIAMSKTYLEGFRLCDEFLCSEKINRILYKKLQNYRVYLDNETEISDRERGHEAMHGMYREASLVDVRLDDVLLLQKRYLQVSYENYVCWGGAHGFVWKDHLLFDMTLGEEICFADLYQGNEAEFKKIAADYTFNSVREKGRAADRDSAKGFYKKIYQTVSYEMVFFAENGIVVEFLPNEFAEFGCQSYTVEIPYEELELAW